MSRGGWQIRASLYDAAGVAYTAPVAGLTEVGTARVATAGPLASFAQSCDHGSPMRPCMACVKCFRKTLVKMALVDDFSDEHRLERMASIPSIREHLCRVPMHSRGCLCWALGRYDGSSVPLRALQRRTRHGGSDFGWAERWYAPSLALLPRALRSSVADRVTSYVEPMDDRMRPR